MSAGRTNRALASERACVCVCVCTRFGAQARFIRVRACAQYYYTHTRARVAAATAAPVAPGPPHLRTREMHAKASLESSFRVLLVVVLGQICIRTRTQTMRASTQSDPVPERFIIFY